MPFHASCLTTNHLLRLAEAVEPQAQRVEVVAV